MKEQVMAGPTCLLAKPRSGKSMLAFSFSRSLRPNSLHFLVLHRILLGQAPPNATEPLSPLLAFLETQIPKSRNTAQSALTHQDPSHRAPICQHTIRHHPLNIHSLMQFDTQSDPNLLLKGRLFIRDTFQVSASIFHSEQLQSRQKHRHIVGLHLEEQAAFQISCLRILVFL